MNQVISEGNGRARFSQKGGVKFFKNRGLVNFQEELCVGLCVSMWRKYMMVFCIKGVM